jgi:hypothetical protein
MKASTFKSKKDFQIMTYRPRKEEEHKRNKTRMKKQQIHTLAV